MPIPPFTKFQVSTVGLRKLSIGGGRRAIIGTLIGTNYYTSYEPGVGGEENPPKLFGLDTIDKFSDGMMLTNGTNIVFVQYNYATKKIHAYWAGGGTPSGTIAITTASGTTRTYVAGYGGVRGSGNTDSENVDVPMPLNGDWLYYYKLDVPRNVCLVIENQSANPAPLFEGVTTFTIQDGFRGVTQTENITFTSTALNKMIAPGMCRVKYGVKPYDGSGLYGIPFIAATVNPPVGAYTYINLLNGLGSKLALPTDLVTPAEADILKITKNGANVPVTGLWNATNKTVNLDPLANNDVIQIVYNEVASGGVPGMATFTGNRVAPGPLVELPDGIDLSGYTGRFEVQGK